MPSEVISNPDLPQIHEFVTDAYDPSIARKFEEGKVLIFDNFPVLDGVDFEFLQRVGPTPDIREVKKSKEWQLLAPLNEDTFGDHMIRHFTPNLGDALKFQGIVGEMKQRYKDYFDKIFPNYKIIDYDNRWRFAPTREENMHFDIYYHPDTFYIRMFTNFDAEERIWRASYDVQGAYDKTNAEFSGTGPEGICKSLNKRVFGPTTSWSENKDKGYDFPYHEFRFKPGSAWLAYSQLQSHQIAYGNRMMASTCRVEANSMVNPDMHFDRLVKTYQQAA